MFDGELPAAPAALTPAMAGAFVAKEAYSATELSALKLPGLPSSERGVKLAADRGNWPRRPRIGRGGGVEYPLETLPPAIKLELQRRATLAALAVPAPAALMVGGAAPPEKVARALRAGRGHARLDAHIDILTAFDAFRSRRDGLSLRRAMHAFVGLWNSGQTGDPATRAVLATISEPSLRRWLEARRAGDLARLAGNYGNRKGSGPFDGPLRHVRDWLINTAAQSPELSIASIRKAALGAFGEVLAVVDNETGEVADHPLPSLRRMQALIKGWRKANPSLNRRLNDPDAWKNRDMLALGDQDQHIMRPNQLWMIDASPADAHATDGRHAIYALIDVYTRRMMVLVTRTPRTEAVKLLLRQAILAWGVPEEIRTDNGSDFVSREAKRVFAALDIIHDPSTPFAPWEKGIVERVIGTLQHGLFPMLPGYCGHNVAAAQKIRERKAFAARLGEKDAAAFTVSLTAAEIAAAIAAWVNDVYHHQPHDGIGGKSPFQRLAEWQGGLRRVAELRALDMLLMKAEKPRLVGKKGLRLNNSHYWDRAGALIPFIGGEQGLEARLDPADPSVAYIYNPETAAFICTAERLEEMSPGERAAVAGEAKAKQRKAMASQVAEVRKGPGASRPGEVLALTLRHAAERHGALVAAPKAMAAHVTPALEAGAQAAAAAGAASPKTAAPAAGGDVVRLPPRPAPSRQDDEERWWRRYQEIAGRLAAGETVPPADADWAARMAQRPFIKARLRFAAPRVQQELRA